MFGDFMLGKGATIVFVYTRKCSKECWDFVPNIA